MHLDYAISSPLAAHETLRHRCSGPAAALLSDAMARRTGATCFVASWFSPYATPLLHIYEQTSASEKTLYHRCGLLETNRFALSCNLLLRSPTAVKIKLNLKDISLNRY